MSTTLETALPTGVWNADQVHSAVGFSVRHMVVSTFRGGFTDFEALLSVTDGAATLDGSVRSASIDTRDTALTEHLLAEDFLDAARHPQIHFAAGQIHRTGDRVEVDGQLTIKGRSRPVVARGTISDPVADPFGNTRLGLAVEATIDRREFGMDWTANLPGGGLALGYEVTLTVNLEFVQAT